MFCSNCGKELPDETINFCSFCGTGIVKEQHDIKKLVEQYPTQVHSQENIIKALETLQKGGFIKPEMSMFDQMQLLNVYFANQSHLNVEEQKSVGHAGTSTTPSLAVVKKNKSLLKGELNFALVFWVYGFFWFILLGWLWQITSNPENPITFFYFLFAIYSTFAAIVVGRTAMKYQGEKVWKILGLIYVCAILLTQLPGFILSVMGL